MISPTFSLNSIGSTLTISGLNFEQDSRVFTNEILCDPLLTTQTMLKCIIRVPSINSQWSVQVKSGGWVSNTIIQPSIEISNTSQSNTVIFLNGEFSQIPILSRNKILALNIEKTVTVPVTYANTALSFPLHQDFFSTNSFEIYDGTSNTIIHTFSFSYAPCIASISFDATQIFLTGFTYTSQSQMFVNGDPCPTVVKSDTDASCTPPPSLFDTDSSFTVSMVREPIEKKTTTIFTKFHTLTGFVNSQTGAVVKSALSIKLYDNTLKYLIRGISPTPIPFESLNSTSLTFTYPYNAQCGYAFVSIDSVRLSHNILLCPAPIVNSIQLPNKDIGGLVTINGYFLNSLLFNSKSVCISYQSTLGDGSVSSITASETTYNDLDSTYTSKFVVNKGVLKKILVLPLAKSESREYLVAYNPIVKSCTSIQYKVPGQVTIVGENFFSLSNPSKVAVKIGGSQCTNVLVNSDGSQITCHFNADVAVAGNQFLVVSVVVDEKYQGSADVFSYKAEVGSCPVGPNGLVCSGNGLCNDAYICVCGNSWQQSDCSKIYPLIDSITSTKYRVPGYVTILGKNFVNKNLQVNIANSICSDVAVSQDLTTITCFYQSDVLVNNVKDYLSVTVTIDSQFTTSKILFRYTQPTQQCPVTCGNGVCDSFTGICTCFKGWESSNCSIVIPSINSITSTKYKVPGTVTIVGNNFVNLNLVVTIGGSFCGNIVVSQDLTSITCLFQSDVSVPNDNTLLEVSVTIDHKFTTSKQL
ncbi:hypothetical protein CYY_008885, partial [Polysphondylium violaceum]